MAGARAGARALYVLGWARLRRAGMGWDGGWWVGGCNVDMSCHKLVGA